MKKLTTIFLSLLAVICIFAFTACGTNSDNNDGKDNTEQGGGSEETDKNEPQKPQIKYTVTEQEWVEALSLFDNEKVAENKDKLNFATTLTGIYNGVASSGYSIDINNSNKMAYIARFVFNSGVKSTEGENYFWEEEANIIYTAYTDSETKIQYRYHYDSFDICIVDILDYAAGLMLDRDVFDYNTDYDKYEYNEESFEYSSYIEEMKMTFAFKFENGKLIEFDGRREGMEMKYEYSYGSSLTIPEEVRNIPLTEN